MNLLIIAHVWPEPTSSAAGSRMMQLIELFQLQSWDVTIASATADSEFEADLDVIGVRKVAVEMNNSTFDEFIQTLNPQIVMFDRYLTEEQFGWRVAKNCPGALRILDTEDLHCLRYARATAFKEQKEFSERYLVSDISKREIASILRCDISLIISKFEMELLQSFFKIDEALLHYLPFLLDTIEEDSFSHMKEFEERKHFISIGNFLHQPNWDAVCYLKSDIWPLIRKQLPKAEIHIYGAYPSKKVWDLHNEKEGFNVKGRAKDAKSVMQDARVCIAPIRFGAGLKGKLIEAMQCGTPSVTTSIGAEAMHDELPWNGRIENDPQVIANACVELYNNKIEWNQAQKNGTAIINMRYSKEEFGALFISTIDSLLNTLEKHRKANFTGAMLMHHTMQSTKYMSKWIEEKNK